MNRILILLAHPSFEKSRAQYRLLKAAQSIPDITVHDLYQAYPDFLIDIKHEQELLKTHDIILFQHPFYWYSSPALLKEWQDQVLQHGFAYGSEGTALTGKYLANIMSAGGGLETYQAGGSNNHTVNDLLLPFRQTARLCNMTYLPPFVVHSTRSLGGRAIDEHADLYRKILLRLQAAAPTEEQSSNMVYLNNWGEDD